VYTKEGPLQGVESGGVEHLLLNPSTVRAPADQEYLGSRHKQSRRKRRGQLGAKTENTQKIMEPKGAQKRVMLNLFSS
jgi:hypothetical protein